ncbi:hypothetical protein Rsub_01035 [Raphidocelis subcapitata]|uniref:tRNA/rRNA methyltransferase SpoU type domain-containing protein n=1 Tax=Raphidocelis subcapitata TaxID=307507 RepID=A0A2V0NRZ7_9CHLO|nr:hypothetical protein Rsub_01035 [Raphidocelis subcapitata]|eukprot:GBF88323.1 hypothetical protein Rsub_01035 [Raphidocelis subcapitata]
MQSPMYQRNPRGSRGGSTPGGGAGGGGGAAGGRCGRPPRCRAPAAGGAAFGERDYLATRQSRAREEWAASYRAAQARGDRSAGAGNPDAPAAAAGLDPPPRLGGVSVVLCSPLRPRTVGTVARLCSCFEAVDLRLVEPRCNHVSRPALSASKGAQFVVRAARVHGSLAEALASAGAAGVAFTRWGAAAGGPRAVQGVAGLLAAPEVAAALRSGGGRVALVFGREEFGLSDEEVRACALACELPMGRLSESLSLSHAAAIALAALFGAAEGQQQAGQQQAGQQQAGQQQQAGPANVALQVAAGAARQQ